ncbi:MAG: class I SAM-dependent methyltransferase [Jatrophihabitantaceae bacterium]
MHADRARAESFGSAAQQYDRFRPSYPDALIDELVALGPAAVLDVGCGTGKVAVPLAARGLSVLGVEVDGRMAQVARSHGIEVEVGAFETWDAAGRTFDLITSGQAWHWIDPVAGVPKAADLLRPGGRAVLFWNYDKLDVTTQEAVQAVYRRLAPELASSVVVGGNRQSDRRHAEAFEAAGRFASVGTRTYHWEQVRAAADWLAMVGTHSDHLALEPERREQLLRELGQAIGGSVRSRYGTYVVIAQLAG